MINYTKFRSDLYSYKYCVDFLRKRRNLSLTRRIDLVTRTRYPWTELQSDEERFMTSASGVSDDEAVVFFRRKLQTLYKLELERNFPSTGSIREFWALLDGLWHQRELSFMETGQSFLSFWKRQGMSPNRHDAGMIALSSKFLNLMEPNRWPIWDIRRDSRFFLLTDSELRDYPEACYRRLCRLVARIRSNGHMHLYRGFMDHLLELHTAALPPVTPLPTPLVIHLLTKRQEAMRILAVNPALAMEWETVKRHLRADMERGRR